MAFQPNTHASSPPMRLKQTDPALWHWLDAQVHELVWRTWFPKQRALGAGLSYDSLDRVTATGSGIDHGLLTGLTDADHVAGSIAFTATDKVLVRSSAGAGAGEEATLTAAGRALIDDANAAAQRTTLGLGAAALLADPVPIANGGTGQTTAGAAFGALSPQTAKGDLIVAAAASDDRRLAVGADTTKLVADSSQTLGVKWAATVNVVNTVTFFSGPNSAITLTDQAVAATFFVNSNRNVWRVDLTGYAEVRINVRCTVGSASANNPRIRLRYYTSFSTTLSDYLDIGTSEVAASIASAGLATSGWIALAAGAKADVFISCEPIGGDAAADPVIANIFGEFRVPV